MFRRILIFFPLVAVNAYFVEYESEPYKINEHISAPVYTYCGQAAQSVSRTFPFSTVNADMGRQLGWEQNGNIWSFVYTEFVSAPRLNFSPHNGTGNGNYRGEASAVIMARDRLKQEYVINPLTGIPEEAGLPMILSTSYKVFIEPHPARLTDCGRHNE